MAHFFQSYFLSNVDRLNIGTHSILVDHERHDSRQIRGVGSPPGSALLSSPRRSMRQHGRYLQGSLASSLMYQGTTPIHSETNSTPDAFQAHNYTKPLPTTATTSDEPLISLSKHALSLAPPTSFIEWKRWQHHTSNVGTNIQLQYK